VEVLGYPDGGLDGVDPEEAAGRIAAHIRRVRPQVMVTFAPDGAYGHPDHIAVSQLTAAAVLRATGAGDGGAPHRVDKLYQMAWDAPTWELYQSTFKTLTSTVDGVERQATPWPAWAITTRVDCRRWWPRVWKAVGCHVTQMSVYGALEELGEEAHARLWGDQTFYRALSRVNGGRRVETDLFQGVQPDPVPTDRTSHPVALEGPRFRRAGHALVERVARLLEEIPHGSVGPPEATPDSIRRLLGAGASLPEEGTDPEALLARTADLLARGSLYNGHPRFFGYITGAPAPLGILGDLLASAVNPNVGGWTLSPAATEIESQTVRWLAELVGLPADADGLLTSGGNMANLTAFWAARTAHGADLDVREAGVAAAGPGAWCVYVSEETHTWVEKAADLSGMGTDAVRWIPTDEDRRMDVAELRRAVVRDRERGRRPFLVVGTAGTTATGAVDPLSDLADLCREEGLWFHVDGAYGGVAAGVPGAPADLEGMARADSVVIDPHKWLYAPLEAGCVLVRRPGTLRDTFAYHPPYYHFGQEAVNYVDRGPQNSRGFRALKVWLTLQQTGRRGVREAVGRDMALARHLFRRAADHPELEAVTQGLSITTFRYVPPEWAGRGHEADTGARLDALNRSIQARLEREGRVFVSNAVVDGTYLLRACIVNFNTARSDVDTLVDEVVRAGRELAGSRVQGPLPAGVEG
jgi:glutamate/tyrosine decarboxylase-like PLP-dependent enzyme/LmbE family N-acetylglucosaminyl deacetylase